MTHSIMQAIAVTAGKHPDATHLLIGELEWGQLKAYFRDSGIEINKDSPLTVSRLRILPTGYGTFFKAATLYDA